MSMFLFTTGVWNIAGFIEFTSQSCFYHNTITDHSKVMLSDPKGKLSLLSRVFLEEFSTDFSTSIKMLKAKFPDVFCFSLTINTILDKTLEKLQLSINANQW